MTSDKKHPTFSLAITGDKFRTYVLLEAYEGLLADTKAIAQRKGSSDICDWYGYECDERLSVSDRKCPCALAKEYK